MDKESKEPTVDEMAPKESLKDSRVQDTRIAVIGNVDSGKSTMIGILTSGVLDNGRGSARSRIFRHDHERQNGRTSCASQHIMGFNEDKKPVHQPVAANATARQKNRAWGDVLEGSSNLITFIDLAGHEKYLKTTIAGLTGCFPDFAMIICGANMGVSKMTREHLAVATALEIPTFVVVTKVDMCPEKVLRHTIKQLFKLLKSPVCGHKMPKIMKKKKDITQTLSADPGLERLCPVFLCSAVTGFNIDKLLLFLSALHPVTCWEPTSDGDIAMADPVAKKGDEEKDPKTVFEIDETFAVKGVGIVVSGTVTNGRMYVNQNMCLGPFSDGAFKTLSIRSVHSKRRPVEDAIAGESCSVSVRFRNQREKVDRAHIRRGMVLVDERHVPAPITRFEAQILVLHHPTTIRCNYEPVLHCGNIRQTVVIEDMSLEQLRSGDSAKIRFRFKCRPEFLHVGRTLILREGNTKCLGKVTALVD